MALIYIKFYEKEIITSLTSEFPFCQKNPDLHRNDKSI